MADAKTFLRGGVVVNSRQTCVLTCAKLVCVEDGCQHFPPPAKKEPEHEDEPARALVASPRWPALEVVAASPYDSPTSLRALDGPLAGARLVRESDGTMVPDLDDSGTEGVLLRMLMEVALVEVAGQKGAVVVGLVVREEDHRGPTLGVAAARALLTVWGAQ